MIWPIDWTPPEGTDPEHVARAEKLAGASLHALTLQRVGGPPVTVMPEQYRRQRGLYVWSLDPYGALAGSFYPGTTYPGLLDSEVERIHVDAVILEGPVGRIDEVRIDGLVFTGGYRVEDGNKLIRLDGQDWPVGSGDNFTVTYLRGYEVDSLGRAAGGILAAEFLKAITGSKDKCRLPSSVTNVARQGLSFTMTPGMFPDGLTSIPEVDAYLYQWNPHGLKTRPQVYSPDKPKVRQTTWRPGA